LDSRIVLNVFLMVAVLVDILLVWLADYRQSAPLAHPGASAAIDVTGDFRGKHVLGTSIVYGRYDLRVDAGGAF
jgi:hypothetical protein